MAENKTIKERLILFIRHLNIGQGKFESRCGLANGYVNNIRRSITPEKLQQIARQYPELNAGWLMTGEGEMLKAAGQSNAKTADGKERMPQRSGEDGLVPLLPMEAFAGPISVYLSEGAEEAVCRRVVSPAESAEFAIQVSGRSMEPLFMDGSVLYVARINEAAFIPWGAPMVVDTDNGPLVKRLYPVESRDDVVEARSVNPDYPPFLVPKCSIRAVYRILASTKFHHTL